MSDKKLIFGAAAREKILHGASILNDAIRVTLGPRSKCVLIEQKWGRPLVCNDGVTIAKAIELADAEENMGAQVIREAAEKTSDSVGDGTSTATVLAFTIFAEGLKNVAAGASSIDLKHGLEIGLGTVVRSLKKISKPVSTKLEKSQVASISAHNDRVMGDLVAEAMERVGRDGVITVEEAKGTETVLDFVEGMQFDRGYLSPYFITDSDKMLTSLEQPVILVCEKKISHLADLLPLLETIVKEHRSLLVIAEDVDGEALATLVINKIRGMLICAAVKAPGFGDRRREILQDIAILTGASLVSDDLGVKLENLTMSMLGSAKRVEIGKDHTVIIGGSGASTAIEKRKQELAHQIKQNSSSYDQEKLRERLAKLAGGVAVIKVGAASESELKSRKEAFDDAISATKAAVEEGVVPGGGLALIKTIPELDLETAKYLGDMRTGMLILRRALETPARQIADNSAFDSGVVVAKMRESNENIGFDAATGRFVDMVAEGIIDPTKVVRIALENAVSVASILLLTEATLTELPQAKALPASEDAMTTPGF